MKRITVLSALLSIFLSVSAQKKYEPGSLVVTRWDGFWHSGIVLKEKKDECLVHSIGYGPGYDRWVAKKDIQFEKPKTKPKQSVASKPTIVRDTVYIAKASAPIEKPTVPIAAIDKIEKPDISTTGVSVPPPADSMAAGSIAKQTSNPPVTTSIENKIENKPEPVTQKKIVFPENIVDEAVPVKTLTQAKTEAKPVAKQPDPPVAPKVEPTNNTSQTVSTGAIGNDKSTVNVDKNVPVDKPQVNKQPETTPTVPATQVVAVNNNPRPVVSKSTNDPVETKKQPYDSKSTWRTKQTDVSPTTTTNPGTIQNTASNPPARQQEQVVENQKVETKTVAYNEKPAWTNTTGPKKSYYNPTMIGEKLYLRTTIMGNAINVSTIYLGKADLIVRNPRNGLEPIDIAFEKKYNPTNTGSYKIEGDKMYVIWSDGKPETWRVDYSDIYLYGIDGKTVTAQKTMPLNYTINRRLVLPGIGKDNNSVTIDFRYDGTFGVVNSALLASAGGTRAVPNDQKGSYTVMGNTLQLKFESGEIFRTVICMPTINGKKWLVINNSVFELR